MPNKLKLELTWIGQIGQYAGRRGRNRILPTLSAELIQNQMDKTTQIRIKSETVSRKLAINILSWSQYCELISIDDEKARAFYQIEAINNKQNFNYGEFAIIKSQTGLNNYRISVK